MTNTILSVIFAGVALLCALLIVRILQGEKSDARDDKTPGRAASETEPDADPPPRKHERTPSLPRILFEEDEELEITKVTLLSGSDDDDAFEEATERYEPSVVPIVYDQDAAVEEPTGASAYILVSAVGQTDRGKRRRRNEDAYLILDDPPLFVVADGMGGYAGGDVASAMAVDTFAHAFMADDFDVNAYPGLSRRASAIAQVIQRANRRIFQAGRADRNLRGMGTTLVCARFSPNKQRVYLGHVGDSRCYVFREHELHRITSDHTAASLGVIGPLGHSLTRALGVAPSVIIDLILGKPRPGDRYLLCSDGLSKMVTDEKIQEVLTDHDDPNGAVDALVAAANEHGGKDNITVIMVRIDAPAPTPSSRPTG